MFGSIVSLALLLFNALSFFVNLETVNTRIYEPITVIQTTENSVVEVIEDTYYKDKNGEYYVISEELPKFKENLWNLMVYAEMEKIDYPVCESKDIINRG
jgi:hypothetical protein